MSTDAPRVNIMPPPHVSSVQPPLHHVLEAMDTTDLSTLHHRIMFGLTLAPCHLQNTVNMLLL